MKLGDVIRGGIVGITSEGLSRPLPLTVIRKPIEKIMLPKLERKNTIIIASHYRWLDSRQFIPKNCIKVFHSFDKPIEWCGHPQAALSESDMVDKCWCGGVKAKRKPNGVLMVTLDHEAGMHTKGFYMTAAVAQACKKIGERLTIIDYGRGGGTSSELEKVRNFLSKNNYAITRRKPDNDQKALAEIFRDHKLFVCSSIKDASPKTVPESLCRGLRVVMNKSCWGGKKYINEANGRIVKMPESAEEMWDNFKDIVDGLCVSINDEINRSKDPSSISDLYHSSWGLYNSSMLLASELKNQFPGYVAICYEEFRKHVLKEVLCRKGN